MLRTEVLTGYWKARHAANGLQPIRLKSTDRHLKLKIFLKADPSRDYILYKTRKLRLERAEPGSCNQAH